MPSNRWNEPPRGEPGIVVYTAAFLASIQCSAVDPMWRIYGLVIDNKHPRFWSILWIDGHVSTVNRANICPIGSPFSVAALAWFYGLRSCELPSWYKARFPGVRK